MKEYDVTDQEALENFNPFGQIFQFLLIILVTYRVTRLIAADAFPLIAIPREWIMRKLGDDHWVSYAISCMWCASMYVATGVVLLFDHYGSVPMPVAQIFASSAMTGYLAMSEPEVD
jgi:hypothetical protein